MSLQARNFKFVPQFLDLFKKVTSNSGFSYVIFGTADNSILLRQFFESDREKRTGFVTGNTIVNLIPISGHKIKLQFTKVGF